MKRIASLHFDGAKAAVRCHREMATSRANCATTLADTHERTGMSYVPHLLKKIVDTAISLGTFPPDNMFRQGPSELASAGCQL